MKQRCKSYLGTFVNNYEGISSYKLMVKTIRQTVSGGRFVKMFRGNKIHKRKWPCGSVKKEGATHFDVYLMNRGGYKNGQYGWSIPQFYNFTLS